MKVLLALIPVAIFVVSCQATDPPDYLESVIQTIKERESQSLGAFSKLDTGMWNLSNAAGDHLEQMDSKLGEAIEPLVVALDATKETIPSADLSKGQEQLENLITEAMTKTKFVSVWDTLKKVTDLIGELQTIEEEFKKSAEQLTQTYFETQCKKGVFSDSQFRECVGGIFQEFLKLYDQTTDRMNNISTQFASINANFNGYININFNFQIIFNLSIEIGGFIFINNNITEEDILNYGLKFNTYNITPIIETISAVNASANELNERNTFIREDGTNRLIVSGSAIYDIVGAGRVYCNSKLIDEKLNNGKALVAEKTAYAFSVAPVLLPTIAKLFQQAATVNTTLYEQIAKLNKTRINKVCPLPSSGVGSLFLKYLCILKEVNKFGVYYEAELRKIRDYPKNAQEKLNEGKNALAKWRAQVVAPEAIRIEIKLRIESELFYKQCNITVEKLINFALFVAQSHYSNFQARITATFSLIIQLADIVISRTYTGNITARLELATKPLTTAIEAVLASKNSSVITSEVYLAKSKLFQDAELDFQKVLANFSVQAKLYKQISSALLVKREEIQKSVNYSNLNSICNTVSWFPLTDLISCALGQVYNRVFVQGNNRTLTILSSYKQTLYEFEQNATAIIQQGADIIVEEYIKDVYYFAYKLYVLAGLKVPWYVLKYSGQNRCVRAVQLIKYYCVVTK